jgi:hypothetical protein
MENINELKVLLNYKQSEKKLLESQLAKVNQDIYKLSDNFDNELKIYVHRENRERFLLEHDHYKNNHVLKITSEWYYDTDWFKYKYGVKNPYDEYGREYPYEGPDTMAWGICEKCGISINIPCKKEQDTSEIVEKEFENHILRKKQSELRKKIM